MMRTKYKHLLWLVLALVVDVAAAAPDEDILGKGNGYWYPRSSSSYTGDDERYKVGHFSHLDQVLDSRAVKRGGRVTPLLPHEAPPPATYQFKGETYTVDDFLNHQRIAGLLILKDGKIVTERYQYDRKPEMHFVSFSMAKSITAMLVGAALKDGKIASLDDPADRYVPDLKNTAFNGVTIRNLLRMSSGAKFDQGANSGADRDRINRETFSQRGSGGIKIVSWIKGTETPQGTRFKYSNADTHVLGLVLEAAVGKSIVEYSSEKLWQPLGAEDDAAWIVDGSGMAIVHAGFNACLRDYARIGLMLANDGELNGVEIVDKAYLLEATDYKRQPPYLRPFTPVPWAGYGYQFWIWPYEARTFSMIGAYGQMVVVQPESKIVIVMTAIGKAAEENIPERSRFIYGVLKSLHGSVEAYSPGKGH